MCEALSLGPKHYAVCAVNRTKLLGSIFDILQNCCNIEKGKNVK